MQDPSERAPPPRVGPHPPSLRRCAGFRCSTGSAAVLGGAKHRVFRSALASPRRAAAELYALDSARAAKPVALFCFPDPSPPPPPRRPATYPPARPPPARRAWGGRGGGGGGGRRGTTCSSAAGSSLKNKLAFFRSFDRVRNCPCRAVREAVREW